MDEILTSSTTAVGLDVNHIFSAVTVHTLFTGGKREYKDLKRMLVFIYTYESQ